MKKVLVNISLLILLVAACSPQAQPTDLPVDVEEPATPVSEELTPAQRAAVDAVARNLGLADEQIKLVSTEAMEWPDSCLGIAMEDVSCAQVVTSGFQVLLEVNGLQVEYRTNEDGTVILPATTAVTWNRSGGIAGFCDSLTIYLSGEVRGTNCNTSKVVEKRLTELVAAQEIDTMFEWIEKYGVVEIDMSDPKGVSDAMSVKLAMMGQGTEEPSGPEVQQALLQFVGEIYQELMMAQ